jgi:UDP-N-acetylglucosamine/UDP-N-acetylgalactosamine diphosphorylase
LDQKHRLSLGPDGHGGALQALRRSGTLEEMQRRGVETLSYFQVDNPLVKPFDPLFIGLHVLTGSQMSTKVTRKVDDHERVGNVCVKDGRLTVIEYSDFPTSHATARNADGSRRFDAGNLAIHLFDLGFVRRVTDSALALPFRRAEKAVPFIDENGIRVEPKMPNAVKLETFIFDVLPLANSPLVFEVDRAEEFSPIKNAAGPDSLETSKRDQVRRACRWLESAGVAVPRRSDGEPDITLAISPLFASDPTELNSRTRDVPDLKSGQSLFLARERES